MTAIEWIELAQERISKFTLTIGERPMPIEDAVKYLNEAKALIHEHQAGLLVKNEEILTTNEG